MEGDVVPTDAASSVPRPLAHSETRLPPRMSGVVGNERITGQAALLLLLMLAAEGVTIVFIGQLLDAHIFIGLALIPPVLLKLASTGYRFAKYYLKSPAYRDRGAPNLILRATAPFTVILTALVLATGVALLIQGPPSSELVFLHKVAFFGWLGFMGIHVLGHLLQVPRLASADWRRVTPEAAIPGSTLRIVALTAALGGGLVVGAVGLSVAGGWLA